MSPRISQYCVFSSADDYSNAESLLSATIETTDYPFFLSGLGRKPRSCWGSLAEPGRGCGLDFARSCWSFAIDSFSRFFARLFIGGIIQQRKQR